MQHAASHRSHTCHIQRGHIRLCECGPGNSQGDQYLPCWHVGGKEQTQANICFIMVLLPSIVSAHNAAPDLAASMCGKAVANANTAAEHKTPYLS